MYIVLCSRLQANNAMMLMFLGGSTLEAMAHGVDNARAVIIFYGNEYKQSFACRTGMTIFDITQFTHVQSFMDNQA